MDIWIYGYMDMIGYMDTHTILYKYTMLCIYIYTPHHIHIITYTALRRAAKAHP